MRILVTGGAGFIGSHMAERLVADGHDVVVIDNESTGRRENVPPAVRYIKGDITQADVLESAFAGGLDAVFHIVGQVSLIRAFSDPVADLRTNVQGTVNVLQLCLKYRVPRLLYASSMTVYGNTGTVPTPETAACAPVSYYGITKYAGERYVHVTARRIDLEQPLHVTSFRMYNVYGPRQALDNPYQGVLGIFLGNIRRGEPIGIFGDGEQSRDFVYIDDVVEVWVGALDNPRAYGGVFNIGSGRRIAINDLADRALAAHGLGRSDHEIRHHPERPGEQRHVEADIRRARALLGWRPAVSFADGLSRTVRWAATVALGEP